MLDRSRFKRDYEKACLMNQDYECCAHSDYDTWNVSTLRFCEYCGVYVCYAKQGLLILPQSNHHYTICKNCCNQIDKKNLFNCMLVDYILHYKIKCSIKV